MKNNLVSGSISEIAAVGNLTVSKSESYKLTYVVGKQFIDTFGSIIALILTLPVIVLLSVLIITTTRGSIIYSHERVGKNGKIFKIYKFRSMRKNSEPVGPQLATRNDPRITKVGRFMRRWRLDEIPNLINVLKGEMSLVGPRPERSYYIEQIVSKAPEYSKLLNYKPGVTSLGEVEFGYAENVDQMIQRMRFDLKYIEEISVLSDVVILARSILVILSGKGV